MTTLLAIACSAFCSSILLTLLVRAVARKLHLVDRPDGHRKLHEHAIPLGGGLAVLLAGLCAMVVAFLVPNPWRDSLMHARGELVQLLVAVVAVCAVGLADDYIGLRGRQKLVGQLLAALILTACGFVIRTVRIFDWQVDLGPMAVPFTLFWLLGAINALNLTDGTDGLAATVGIILSVTVAAMALALGHGDQHLAVAAVAVALAGSLFGFLFFNFPPATIFLGDAGSMLIGLTVGALAIRCSVKGPTTVALAAPLALWTIPILDSAMAILRRKLTGRSIYETDRAHLHHCLLHRGYSRRQTLAWIALFCATTALGAWATVYLHNELFAVVSALAVVSILIATRMFGHAEFLLLSSRLKAAGISLVSPAKRRNGELVPQSSVRLQSSKQWDQLWTALTELADRLKLCRVQLNISLPALHEEYHASWERSDGARLGPLWRTEIPLVARDHAFGRLEISGERDGSPACVDVGRLAQLLHPLETRMVAMAEQSQPAVPPDASRRAQPGDGERPNGRDPD